MDNLGVSEVSAVENISAYINEGIKSVLEEIAS
jgi:hypothetical protein